MIDVIVRERSRLASGILVVCTYWNAGLSPGRLLLRQYCLLETQTL